MTGIRFSDVSCTASVDVRRTIVPPVTERGTIPASHNRMFGGNLNLMMKITHTLPVLALAFVATACGNDDSKRIDDALNNDLSLASQARPFNPLDSVSSAERNNVAPQPTQQRRTAAPRQVSRSSSSSSSASSGSTAREPEYRVVKNTKRDAAIGAGAGAIIGVATSKDKVKGGLIGAAAGGLLGAVIGNNVDKKKVPVER